MRVKEAAAAGTKPRAYAVRCRWLPWSPRAHRWAEQLLSASPGGDDLISTVIFAIVLVPLIVVLVYLIGELALLLLLVPLLALTRFVFRRPWAVCVSRRGRVLHEERCPTFTAARARRGDLAQAVRTGTWRELPRQH